MDPQFIAWLVGVVLAAITLYKRLQLGYGRGYF